MGRGKPARAANFIEKLISSTRRLQEFPESGHVVPENQAFRQVILQGYRLIYRVRGGIAEVVTIVSPGQNADLKSQHQKSIAGGLGNED